MNKTTLKREKSVNKEKLLARVENKNSTFYSVQCVEYLDGRVLENKSYSSDSFSDALLAYYNCFNWLTLGDRLSKARSISQRIRSKINQYENMHDDFSPHYMVKARKKIQRWIFKHEPSHTVKRDFWDCYL